MPHRQHHTQQRQQQKRGCTRDQQHTHQGRRDTQDPPHAPVHACLVLDAPRIVRRARRDGLLPVAWLVAGGGEVLAAPRRLDEERVPAGVLKGPLRACVRERACTARERVRTVWFGPWW